MTDTRIQNFARILVDYSTEVQPGDLVGIQTSTPAEPLARELYRRTLERGGFPHLLLRIEDQEELLFNYASDDQLDFTPLTDKLAFEQFDVLIKIRAQTNTRLLTNVEPRRFGRYQKNLASLLKTQMQRGADQSLRWMSTLFPTPAYAMEAEMGHQAYQDFFYRACHADLETPDPVAHWRNVQKKQQVYVDRIEGRDRVEIRGPNAELSLSIKGRKFRNSCGKRNLPDGEIFTGPVEDSVNGWVRFTYPAVYQGVVVEGVELTFENGQVVNASAKKNQEYLTQMLEADEGARYLGEFAIGMNYEIDRFTKSILLDEKIGGSFHLALGAGYPETGSRNKSAIHWDMICDIREESEILVDGELVYRNGSFNTD